MSEVLSLVFSYFLWR